MSRLLWGTPARAAAAFLLAALVALTAVAAAPKVALADEGGDGLLTATVTGTYRQTEARSMLDMINEFRTTQPTKDHKGNEAWYWEEDGSYEELDDLGTLSWDYALEKIAMQRAVEIAVNFDHQRPNGQAFNTVEAAGVTSYGENLSNHHETAREAFESLREDGKDYAGQGHRRNMLKPGYTAIGIAGVQVGDVVVWVQEFGWKNSGQDATPANDAEFSEEVGFRMENAGSLYLVDKYLDIVASEETKLPTLVDMHSKGGAVTAKVPVDPGKWTAAKPEVVSISSDGKMLGLKVGSTKISNPCLERKRLMVTVRLHPVNLSFASSSESLSPEDAPFQASVTCDSPARVVYESSDTSVAKVSSDGVVTPVGPGRATITAKVAETDTHEAASAEMELVVTAASATASLGCADAHHVGETFDAGLATDSDGTVSWSSSDPSVVSVDDGGRCRALKEGKATIVAEVAASELYPACRAEREVRVTAAPPKACEVSVWQRPGQMTVGDSFGCRAWTSSGADVRWSSSDASVASVDASSGTVRANKAGHATIRVECGARDGWAAGTASFDVTVVDKAPVVAPTKPSAPAKVTAPKATSLTKVSKAKKAFKAKWKKVAGAKGYQLRWSTKPSMKGSKAALTKACSKKVTKLKKKRYYVQVRSYKVVGGKTYWSGWSKKKSVKVR